MTETVKRRTRVGTLLAAIVVALTLAFSTAAWATMNTADEGPVDYGENGAVNNGQPTGFSSLAKSWLDRPLTPTEAKLLGIGA